MTAKKNHLQNNYWHGLKVCSLKQLRFLTHDNIETILAGAELSLADVARVTVYLTNIADAAAMNEIYLKRFGERRPAREMMAVAGLAFGAKIEITAIAYRKT